MKRTGFFNHPPQRHRTETFCMALSIHTPLEDEHGNSSNRVTSARLVLPVQTVDATPSNALIRECFPGKTHLFGRARSKPSQGSVPVI